MDWIVSLEQYLHLQAAVIELVGTVLGYIGLGLMKDGGFFQMLSVTSIIFCALLSIPLLRQRLRCHHWLGMTVICGGIAIKSIPAIRDFINPDRIDVSKDSIDNINRVIK